LPLQRTASASYTGYGGDALGSGGRHLLRRPAAWRLPGLRPPTAARILLAGCRRLPARVPAARAERGRVVVLVRWVAQAGGGARTC